MSYEVIYSVNVYKYSSTFQHCLVKKLNKPFLPYIKRLHLCPSNPWFLQKGINSPTASRFEAGTYYGRGFLRDCIGVRLHDLQGRPIGYAGRRMNRDQVKKYGKWKFPLGLPKSEILYNYHRASSQVGRGLVIVEGPWGVMRLDQLKIPSVALLGICLSHIQRDLLRKISPVFIMLDGDCAGRKASTRIQNALQPHLETHIISLPQGLDPDDLTDHDLLSQVRQYFAWHITFFSPLNNSLRTHIFSSFFD